VGNLHGEVYKFGRVEVDDAGFDVVTGEDEGEMVSLAAGKGIGVAGVLCVEDVRDCCEGLVFVVAADVLVGCDFPGSGVSLESLGCCIMTFLARLGTYFSASAASFSAFCSASSANRRFLLCFLFR
jgi:hypothetical protein